MVISPRLLTFAAVQASALALAWHLGAGRVQGQWDAAELQRERAIATHAAQETRRQSQAAAEYAAQAQQIRAAAALALPEVRHELQRPISCPAGGTVPMADLPVPATVLDRLRHAGADPRVE
ncbi:hypothetical protein [Roseateles cavernae]|uniref:hypothetical protein n=1 Tax=Roseateles cavernae TaxID=3153578 RepID=UPI0032E4E2BB